MTFNGVTSLNVYWLRIHMLQKLKHVPSQFQVQAQIKKKTFGCDNGKTILNMLLIFVFSS